MVGLHNVALGGVLLGVSCASGAADVHVVHGLFTRTGDRIAIDGRLDEPAWKSAPPFAQFFEVYPANVGDPTFRTEVRFLYDHTSLYIGVRAYDSNPAAIRSAVTRRDQVLADQDYLELLVDAQNGRRTALLFRVNPKGIATDGVFDEHAQVPDYSVDLNFDVGARVDESGWVAEFRIPFSTLRYRPGNGQAWTIGIRRNVPRVKTVTIASAPISRKANCTLCFFDEIGDLNLGNGHDPLTLVPYMSLAHDQVRSGDTTSHSDVGQVGFDAKWQPHPDLAIDLTVHPDFSEVEADDLQLAANRRFALLLTEKRPFFFEGTDLLSTATLGINAIYTRSLTAPDEGLRATRRGEDYEYSALVLRDSGGGTMLEPGTISSRSGPQDLKSTAFAGRGTVRTSDVVWGALASTRFNKDGSSNVVYGLDATWSPTSSDRIFAQFLDSRTTNPNRPDLLDAWTGQRLEGTAGALTWTHSNTLWYADVYYVRYANGFRAWDGYVPQVGVYSIVADAGLNFYPHAASLVRISPVVSMYHIEEVNGGELGKYLAPGVVLEGPGNTSLSIYWYPRFEDVALTKDLRTYHYTYFSLLSSPAAWTPQMKITASIGQGLDAATGQIGRSVTVQALVPIRPLRMLEVRPMVGYQTLGARDSLNVRESLFSEVDLQLDALWYLTDRCYLEGLYQKSRISLSSQYAPPAPASRTVNSLVSLMLSYQTNWQTRFYVGFRRARNSPEGDAPTAQDKRSEVFAKLSYAFSR